MATFPPEVVLHESIFGLRSGSRVQKWLPWPMTLRHFRSRIEDVALAHAYAPISMHIR
jgi:hypothetical protein